MRGSISICNLVRRHLPNLTVIDATRILVNHRPTGGNLADVREKNTVIAGIDPVLSDACAVTLFDMKPEDIWYVRHAAETGLGSMDLRTAKIVEVSA